MDQTQLDRLRNMCTSVHVLPHFMDLLPEMSKVEKARNKACIMATITNTSPIDVCKSQVTGEFQRCEKILQRWHPFSYVHPLILVTMVLTMVYLSQVLNRSITGGVLFMSSFGILIYTAVVSIAFYECVVSCLVWQYAGSRFRKEEEKKIKNEE